MCSRLVNYIVKMIDNYVYQLFIFEQRKCDKCVLCMNNISFNLLG